MITGMITAAREAVIPVVVHGPAGDQRSINAVIDTGFTGFLTLPASFITALGLPFVGTTRAMLSDGSEIALDVFEATVMWDIRSRLITVLATEGGIVVGMAMLFGSRLTLEGAVGGRVQIEALP